MVERGKRRRDRRPPTPPAKPDAVVNRVAYAFGMITLLGLAWALIGTNGQQFLSPGPLISAHRTIENCDTCHTQSKLGKFGWIQRLLHDESANDVKACIACHEVNGDVLFAHTAKKSELESAQQRLLKISQGIPRPLSAQVRNAIFPELHLRLSNMKCANCHKEHRGANFNLEAISDEQCQACHVVQFDSFDGNHPAFDNYPFKRRTRLIYDHASHFGRFFPQTRERNLGRKIPSTCSNCHTSYKSRQQMMFTSFDQTCSTCHLDQILGKEQVSGRKGIAFLTLPGVDLATLRERNAAIGEWPEFSEAEVTPFMKVLLSRREQGLELLRTINQLDLMDLSRATDQEIDAVTKFIWEIKGLYYALVTGAASDVMAHIDPRRQGASSGQRLISTLTANLQRDVIIAAQQEWLPNLGTEMANGATPSGAGWTSTPSESRLAGSVAPAELPWRAPSEQATEKITSIFQRLAQAGSSANGEASGNPPAAPSEAVPSSAAPQIESPWNAETWAEHGGWYRQDFAINYRPAGHKDAFIRTWLDLTGPYALEAGSPPAAQLFDLLASRDGPGKCTKCHSVDTIEGEGRKVNWSPASPETKQGRFTTFIHEPHFSVMNDKGCLTCHKLQQDVPYSKSFEQGNPQSFVSGFSQVDKALCQTCHTQGVARQDCMLCHKYHINGIATPTIDTQLPQQ
ncbi:MAG: hypothetical protein ACFCUR_20585 [Rhodomicrobiaceae bacterium]